MRRIVVPALVASLMLSGCFGSFKLVSAVHKFNKGISSNKFVQELVFLVMYFVPVYGFAAIIDSLILNTIEFWTGRNPMAHLEVPLEDGRLALLDRDVDGNVTLTVGDQTVRLVHDGDQMALYDATGSLVATAIPTAEGGLSMTSVNGSMNVDAEAMAAFAANPVEGLKMLEATAAR